MPPKTQLTKKEYECKRIRSRKFSSQEKQEIEANFHKVTDLSDIDRE